MHEGVFFERGSGFDEYSHHSLMIHVLTVEIPNTESSFYLDLSIQARLNLTLNCKQYLLFSDKLETLTRDYLVDIEYISF